MKKTPQLPYFEYIVNGDHIKRLYDFYIRQSIWDKVLDVVVFIAILFTIMALILEFLIGIEDSVIHFIHSISAIVIFIFMLELLRDYAKSKTSRAFFKTHWIDVLLVTVLSLYFLFSYFGLAKLKGISGIKKYTQEAKHIRVLLRAFRR